MNIKAGRIAIAVVLAEVSGVLLLVALVAIFGPADRATAQTYAKNLGLWVGPISGFVFSFLGALWVAKRLVKAHAANGLVLGVAAAALDIGILVAVGAPFRPVFAVSNIGRILAGTVGGWLAGRRHREAA